MGARRNSAGTLWNLLVAKQQPAVTVYVRDLMAETGYSRRSVQRGLAELEQQGLITRELDGAAFRADEPPQTLRLNRTDHLPEAAPAAAPVGGLDVPQVEEVAR